MLLRLIQVILLLNPLLFSLLGRSPRCAWSTVGSSTHPRRTFGLLLLWGCASTVAVSIVYRLSVYISFRFYRINAQECDVWIMVSICLIFRDIGAPERRVASRSHRFCQRRPRCARSRFRVQLVRWIPTVPTAALVSISPTTSDDIVSCAYLSCMYLFW